jgi:mono/diheme cytochrome c family protein
MARRIACCLALFLTAVILVFGAGQGASPSKTPNEGDAPSQYSPAEDASYERGGTTYFQLCHVCHGEDGRGAPIIDDPDDRKMAPSLSGSRRVLGRPEYVITALLTGVTGPMDGENYQGLMVSMSSYPDTWVADVASYIRNSFENAAPMITPKQVTRVRKRLGGRSDPLTVDEILSTLPMPLTNQADWKVSASHNSQAAVNAVLRQATEPWNSGCPQRAGIWFQIELPEPVMLWDFNLASPLGASLADTGFARSYKVQVSVDGQHWTESVAEGAGRSPYLFIPVGPVRVKAIRMTLTAATPEATAWAISRTQILQEGASPAVLARRPVVNPFE